MSVPISAPTSSSVIFDEHTAAPAQPSIKSIPRFKSSEPGLSSAAANASRGGQSNITSSLPRSLRVNLPPSTGVNHPRHDPRSSPELISTTDIPQQSIPSLGPATVPKEPPSPRVRPIEKVNNSTVKRQHKTIDEISQSIGFLKPEKLIRHLISAQAL